MLRGSSRRSWGWGPRTPLSSKWTLNSQNGSSCQVRTVMSIHAQGLILLLVVSAHVKAFKPLLGFYMPPAMASAEPLFLASCAAVPLGVPLTCLCRVVEGPRDAIHC